jgi:hypothetical protein
VAVTVKATFREIPLPGARVGWYRVLPPDGAAVAEGVADGAGVVAARLPPGRYFVLARWKRGANVVPPGDTAPPETLVPGDRFGYLGGNPVAVSAGATEVVLPLSEIPSPPSFPGEPGGAAVRGVVTADGAPVRDGYVSAYRDGAGGFREMPYAVSSPTEGDGTFSLDLPPGRWYLVARKRAGGGAAGPLRPGDAFGYLPGNPLLVEGGRSVSVALPVSLRKRGPAGGGVAPQEVAVVEGRIVGVDGRPRRGVVAALYGKADRFGRPRFMSEPTGPDGAFRLPVSEPGKYYLGARTGYGGSPAPGDLQGKHDGSGEPSVTVREGDRLVGVEIVVEEVW